MDGSSIELSRGVCRKLNDVLHMAAVTQIRNPGTKGRIYFERKVAEGKTKKEALLLTQAPDLQRCLPPAAPRRRKGVREDTRKRRLACVIGSTP